MKSPETRGWIRSLIQSWLLPSRQLTRKSRGRYRLQVETLEDRVVPTSYTVNSILASGAGSLFQAVQDANSNTTSPSFITFDPTVFATPQTITLAASLILSNTTQPVTIQGPTDVAVTISGNRLGGAQIQDVIVNTGVTATIQNLTFTQGNGGLSNGGAFSVGGGALTIDYCTISNSSAYSGGGINVSAGNVLIENSIITGNITPNTGYGTGGGLNVTGGAVTVVGCLVTQNSSNGINGGTGGGLYVGGGITTAIDSTFTANSAVNNYNYGGGAIGTPGGTVNLVHCTVSGNTAPNATGGGLWSGYSSTVNLTNDIFWNNTARIFNDVASIFNGPVLNANYSLIGDPNGAQISSGAGDIIGVATSPAILGPLGNHGGPTPSFAPLANSFPVESGGKVTVANAAVSSTSVATLGVANGFVFAASSLTPQLSFVIPPSDSTAGAPLAPVSVQVSRPIDFDEYIQIDNEIMEIIGLTINANGTATLNVERGVNGTTAATHDVNAPIYLISDQRGQIIANSVTSPPVDMGSVQSTATAPAAGLGLALTMGISSGTLNGTTTALTNSAGQAVFNNLSVPAPGTYQLKLAGIVTSNSFTVTMGTYPIVTSISPASGSSGDAVTITGMNFTGATTVSFGTAAANFTVNADTSITATAPGGAGVVDITVTTSVGTSALSASDKFSYAPVVTSISPISGSAGGGTSVTITGANFTGVTAVEFGTSNAVAFSIDSNTQITATSPAGAGVVDITVVNSGGASAVSNADHFAYSTGTATWTVTNTLGSGAGSLFKAVQSANADTATPSYITFDPTVFATAQTITLGTSLVLSNATEPITIQGPTDVTVTISGNRLGGAQIQDVIVNTGVTATIQNLTFTQGNGGSNNGGAFSVRGGVLTIDHCTISNSSAYSGGGINVSAGNVLIENSIITGNITPNTGYGTGGGLNVLGGAVTVLSCLFTQNSSNGINAGTGGAIFVTNGVLTIVDSTLTGNTAANNAQYGGSGGAIATQSGPSSGFINVVGCTITGNNAASGGGIAAGYYYTANLDDDIIWNNTAPSYPDIYLGNYSTPIVNYTLVGNTSGSGIPGAGVGNILNVAATPAILGALGNHGGPTLSFAPVAGSFPVGAGGPITTANGAINDAELSAISVAKGALFAASSLTQLSFVTQPTSTVAGAPLNPVTVQMTNPVDFGEFIQIDSEEMQVVGLTMNANGTATLYVDRGVNGTSAATHANNAPIYLVSDQRGQVVNQGAPPPVDMGSVQSSANTTPALASFGLALSMGISSGTLSGTTTAVTDASGLAVFNNLSVPATGTYQLRAAGVTPSNSFTIITGNYPIVTSMDAAYGSPGAIVGINGTGFSGATAVAFGGTPASFTVNSSTHITATAPAGAGIVDVTVTTPVGTSATSSSDRFTYASPAPSVTNVSPDTGATVGGTSVTITGTNFIGTTAVKFGSTAAASFTVNSATQITATSPSGAGTVDIAVVTPAGTSATSSGDQFTYSAAPTIWTVTNTLGSGPGSLFQAVQNADSDGTSPSIITFDPTVFATPQTITLTASLILSNTSEPVTIQGPTDVTVTISGNRLGGAQIQDVIVNTGVTATIQNLIFTQGNGALSYGGAFNVFGGVLTIDHCTISNSSAYSGGGINVSAGNVLIENSIITGNTTPNTGYGTGGGLNVTGGAVTVVGCLFTQNSSHGINGGTGGAIFVTNGVLTIVDSTLTGNTAANNGGYAGSGGAIATQSGPGSGFINVIGCTISGNNATSGGGMLASYYYTADLEDDIIWNNTASNFPDIYLGNYSTPTVNYTLVGNTSGSGIPASGVGNILNVPTSPAILGPLADNGGPTQSMAPVPGSLPIHAGGRVTLANAAIGSATVTAISVANGSVFAASSLTQLSFITQPNNAPAGATLNPVIVQAIDPVDFGAFIQIDSEEMQVVGLTKYANGTATVYVERGVDGTTAATHATNAPIYLVSDQRGQVVNQGAPPPVDMGSVQSSANTTPSLASNPNLGLTLSMGISAGTLSGTTTAVTDDSGLAVFDNLSVPATGTFQLRAAGLIPSHSFTITPSNFPVVAGISPSSGFAGTIITIMGTGFTGATGVSFGSTAATSFRVDSGTQITATAPRGSGTVDVKVTTPAGTSATSSSDHFTYLNHFNVAFSPPTVTAGHTGTFRVTILDGDGNRVTDYNGTVHFTSSDSQAILSADYTFTAADMGSHLFGAVLKTAGTQTITATDRNFSLVNGTSSGIIVRPAPDAGRFNVTGFPSPVQAGTPGSFQITVFDAFGNVATDYTGTVTFSSSDPQADLPNDYTFAGTESGRQTFVATLKTAGTVSIGVADTRTGVTGSVGNINVTPGVAVSFAVFGITSPVPAGTIVLLTVTAVDAFGNTGAIYLGTVHFTSSDATAYLPDDYTFTAADRGTLTFAVVFNGLGTQSLTATDTLDPTITGTLGDIGVI